MKVLLVSQLCPPLLNAEAILVWKTVRVLAKSMDVTVVTSATAPATTGDAQMVLPDNVVVRRLNSWKPQHTKLGRVSEKLLGRFVDEAYFWAQAAQPNRILTEIDPYDVLYSRSHPGASHILAYRLKQMMDRPWVAQFSDPWANNPYHRNHTVWRKSSDARWEQRIIETADVLVFPTVEIQEMYGRDYPTLDIAERSVVLPHHFTPDLYPDEPTDEPCDAEPARLQRPVKYAYFGDFYGQRSPAPLIEAFDVLRQRNRQGAARIQIEFFGNIERKFGELVQRSTLPITSRKVSYLDSLREMMSKDVLLLIDAPSETGVNPFLASKLVDYLGTGKRILGITDERGTSAELLRRYGHRVVRPDDVSGIATAVEACLGDTALAAMRPPELTSSFVVGQLAALFDSLCGRPGTA